MKFAKSLLIISLVLMLSIGVSAQSASVPTEVPTNTNWTITVNVDSFDFTEAEVQLAGSKIASVFAYGGNKFATESYGSNVADISENGSTVLVTVKGLSEGSHQVNFRVLNGGGVKTETSHTVTAFTPVKQEALAATQTSLTKTNTELERLQTLNNALETQLATYKTEMAENLSSVQSTLDTLNESSNELLKLIIEKEATIQSLRDTLISVNRQVDYLVEETQHLADDAANLKQEDIENLNTQVKEIQDKLTESEEQANSLSGLLTLPEIDLTLALIIVVIVGLGGVVLYLGNKEKEDNLFTSDSKEGEEEGEENEDNEDEDSDTEDEEESETTGKWAVDKPQPKEPEGKRFSLGDLIKRDK